MHYQDNKPFSYIKLLCGAGFALILAGCATPYNRTELNLPTQWAHAPKNTTAQVLQDNWWAQLQDPQLNELVELALQRNNDLTAAAWRLRNAQLSAGNAAGALFPKLNASASGNASRSLKVSSTWARNYSASAGISWELDLWGKLASKKRAAQWEAAATAQDRQATAQTLVANVLTSYWNLAVLNKKWATAQDTLQRAQKTLSITQAKYKAGTISGLEIAQARQSLAATKINLENLKQQRIEQQHTLAIVFDMPPQQLPPAAQNPRLPNINLLPEIAAELPLNTINRRPDVQAAEMRLRATLAQNDATKLSYLPGFNLTGSAGSASSLLHNVLKNPTASLGLGLSLPFLNIADMRRNLRTSKNNYELATVNFRQTVYKALLEVENALSQRQQLQRQFALQQQSFTQAKKAESISAVRYRVGNEPLQTWLSAQDSLHNAQTALWDSTLAQLRNYVTLYKVLGGSPKLPDITP